MLKLTSFIKRFGLVEGGQLYWKFRYGKTAELQVSELTHPLFMKPNTIDNCSFQEVFLDQEYSLDFLNLDIEVSTIIDAGANIGFGAVYFVNKYPNAKVVSIEPDQQNFDWLCKNTMEYELISTMKGAVWCSETLIEIKDEGWGSRGYIVEETKNESETTIQGFSIEQIMKANNVDHISILKMDVEGSEKEIFESNYEYWLPRTKCLIVETHDRMKGGCTQSVLNAIEKYNFSHHENGENLIFINQDIK
jgi:FkbM family methyltransferase